MQVDIERRPGSIVALTVTVEPAMVQERMESAVQKAARRINIPGFRPGKAPRKMVEERINHDALMKDVIDDAMNAGFQQALREQQLEPLEKPEVEDIHTDEAEGVKFTVSFPVRPQITLPPLNELVVNYTATQVSDAQVEAEITRLLERTADVVDVEDPIEAHDYVIIDYTMTVDGEPYPEGDMSGYPLEVGTDTFFPALNEGLLGLKHGDTTTLTVSYPDEYTNKSLAGKTATFTISIMQVRRRGIPEATDAWAALVTGGDIPTIAEFRLRTHDRLVKMAAQMDRDQIREALMRQLLEHLQVDLPEKMVEDAYADQMEQLEQRLSRERLTLEQYAEMTNQSVEAIEREQRLLARDGVRRGLVLQQLAHDAHLHITEEDIDALVLMEGYSRGEDTAETVQKNRKRLRKEMEQSGRLDEMMHYLFREKIFSHLESQAQVHIEGLPPALEEAEAAATEPAPDTEDPTT